MSVKDYSYEGKSSYIETYTGRLFTPFDPQPQDVSIVDIAHALSMKCRYTGHTSRFYSVAEHSVLMAEQVLHITGNPYWALWALLHDATEAYLPDVPRPLKPGLVGFREMEANVMEAIVKHFGLGSEMPEIVHEYDTRILLTEAAELMASRGEVFQVVAEPLDVTITGWLPWDAEEMFLECFMDLTGRQTTDD